ncbi:9367_t:CDS:2, partial [Entrophospora sp. SA101]
RFRVRNLIDNEMSYCLTNILAVIGFLETADYLDLNQITLLTALKVADSGVKVITDSFDSSYKLFDNYLKINTMENHENSGRLQNGLENVSNNDVDSDMNLDQ